MSNTKVTSLILLLFLPLQAHAARVEIREGRFYVDHEPFYVRGVGYAPWRPHQRPGVSYTGTNHRWTQMDFERIKAAHFNTIRVWDALQPDDLALAKENGLMVLQGIRLDPKQDFSDPHNQEAAVAQVQSVVEESKDFDNVLGYILMTDPSPQAVLETGEQETLQFFRRLKRTIQAVDPRPVTMDSWPPLAFLDYRDFDFEMFNLYAFWPASITHAMGLTGMTRWFVDHFAEDRPLLVGETGGFSVSEASQTAAGGFGGLTEYNQSLMDLDSLRATVEGHAAGSFLVSWIDPWHFPSDPDTHDNEPWEWSGIVGIPTDSPEDMNGIPRQAYRDAAIYNELIAIDPKANHLYPILQPLPIHVNAADDVAYVRYSLNDGDWTYLDGSGHGWFQGSFQLPKLARKRQDMLFQAMDKNETVLAKKKVSFLAGVLPEQLKIEPEKKNLSFRVTVLDGNGKPAAQRKVDYGCFDPIRFGERQGTLITDASGGVSFSCLPITPMPTQYLYVAAGTESPERARTSDLRIFKLSQ
jgi:hypothetical protein